MFTTRSRTSTSRSLKQNLAFRPWLERLEDRNAPSSIASSPSSGSSTTQSPADTASINHPLVFSCANIVALSSSQQASVSQLFIASQGLGVAVNSPQLTVLLVEEVALGIDTYLNNLGMTNVVGSVPGEISALNARIQVNPMSSSGICATLGPLVFNATLDALTSAPSTL